MRIPFGSRLTIKPSKERTGKVGMDRGLYPVLVAAQVMVQTRKWSIDETVVELLAKDGVELPLLDVGIAHGEKARGGSF